MSDIYKMGIECIREESIGDLLYDPNISRDSLISALGVIAGILDMVDILEEKEKTNE